jgi:mono/diheme cytochrome c family protein
MCPGAGPLVKSRGVFSLPFAGSPLPKAYRCWQGAAIGGSQVGRSNQCSACHGREPYSLGVGRHLKAPPQLRP